MRGLRLGLHILDGRSLAPLGYRLRVIPSSRLNVAGEACNRCIAARTACVVVALP